MDDISEIKHSSQEIFKILSLTTMYLYIHFKEKCNHGNAVLYYTTVNGRLEVFKFLFGQNMKKLKVEQKLQCIRSRGALGRTFLHSGVNQGSLEVIQLLLDDQGCPLLADLTLFNFVATKDDLGYTALHLAVQSNQNDIVRYLLNVGQNKLPSRQQFELISLADQEGRTVLHLAAINGNFEIVKLLLNSAKVSVSDTSQFLMLRDNLGYTALQLSILCQDYKISKFLLDDEENDLSDKEIQKYEKLKCTLELACMIISEQEDCEYVKSCLGRIFTMEQQRELLTATDELQRSVFHYAAKDNHVETLKLLLNNTALSAEELKEVLMLQDNQGNTVLHLAARNGNFNVVKLFMRKSNLRTEFLMMEDILGYTAAQLAILCEEYEIAKFLLNDLQYVFNLRGSINYKKLKATLELGCLHPLDPADYEYVKLCFDRQKNVLTEEQRRKILKASDSLRRSVFHTAASCCDSVTLKYLLNDTTLYEEELKEVLMLQDNGSLTAFQLAVSKGYYAIARLLLNKIRTLLSSEELKTVSELGKYLGPTFFHDAVRSGRHDRLKFLLEELRATHEIFSMKDVNSNTVFHLAAEVGRCDIMKLLLNSASSALTTRQLGSLLFVENNRTETALHLAVIHGHLKIVKLIFRGDILSEKEQKKSITATDGFGCTVFHSAATCGSTAVLKYLLDKSDELILPKDCKNVLMSRDSSGFTVVEAAAESGNSEAVKILSLKLEELRGYVSIARDAYYRIAY